MESLAYRVSSASNTFLLNLLFEKKLEEYSKEDDIYKLLNNFLDELLKEEDLVDKVRDESTIEKFTLNIIVPLVKNKSSSKYFIANVNEKELEKIYNKIKKNLDDFEKKIIKTILNIDILKIDYYKKYGIEIMILSILLKKELWEIILHDQIELIIWLLLYRKDKERVARYKQYIEDLNDDIRVKIMKIYGEYLVDYVDEEEQKEIEEELKDIDLKNLEFHEFKLEDSNN
jgi:hypothetical protein